MQMGFINDTFNIQLACIEINLLEKCVEIVITMGLCTDASTPFVIIPTY